MLPTGDGAAIGFNESPYLPLNLAKEIHKKLGKYNHGKQWLKQIWLHIGLHREDVIPFTDLNEQYNVWGDGIIIAQRVMSKSPAGFILLTEEIGEELEDTLEYKEIIYHAGYVDLKYKKQFVWYAYDDNFGRNDVSQIQDLNTDVQVTNFSAEVDKKQCKAGDVVNVKIDFTGKLHDIVCTVMLRAPKGKKLPDGRKNFWCEFDKPCPQPSNDETLIDVAKLFEWDVPLEKDYPSGIYYLYIRVYDRLKEEGKKRMSVIREKVESLYVRNKTEN